MSMFRPLMYGVIAFACTSFCVGVTITVADQCVLIYLAMILGASISIIKILEKRQ